jgi:hypothetical protein
MRWHSLIWSQLYDMEAAHKRRVKVNKIAAVAVEWGLQFLRSCSDPLQKRILGVEGAPLTLEETANLRKELDAKLGPLAGKMRLDSVFAFRVSRPVKEAIREEAERRDIPMSAIAQERILPRGKKR